MLGLDLGRELALPARAHSRRRLHVPARSGERRHPPGRSVRCGRCGVLARRSRPQAADSQGSAHRRVWRHGVGVLPVAVLVACGRRGPDAAGAHVDSPARGPCVLALPLRPGGAALAQGAPGRHGARDGEKAVHPPRPAFRALAGQAVLSGVALVALAPAASGPFAIAAAAAVLAWYHRFALREFGGVTGDTAGWFLQWCELAMLAV